MAEHDPNDELSVEELEDVAGGLDGNENCSCTNGSGCTSPPKAGIESPQS